MNINKNLRNIKRQSKALFKIISKSRTMDDDWNLALYEASEEVERNVSLDNTRETDFTKVPMEMKDGVDPDDMLLYRACEEIEDQVVTSPSSEPLPDGKSIIRKTFLDSGITNEAVDVMLSSISNNTLQQYLPRIVDWAEYCKLHKICISNPKTQEVITYLTKKFNEGLSYGKLKSLRAALSFLIGSHIGNADNIKRLFKGFYMLRPSAPKYNKTWDVGKLLKFIENQHTIQNNLEMNTKKTVTLLILATGQGAQTLSLIDVKNIVIRSDCVNINKIDNLMKTSAPKCQPLTIPFFNERVNICPARAVVNYLVLTKKIRSTSNLFITLKKPHKGVTACTISRWVKSVMEQSGIDTSIFSTCRRRATTSAACLKVVNINDILRMAGWSGESLTFARFYNKAIVNNVQFAEADFGNK